MTEELMFDCIPFVNSATDMELAEKYFRYCTAVRVSFGAKEAVINHAAESELATWADAGVDGFHWILTGSQSFDEYSASHKTYAEYKRNGERDFAACPPKRIRKPQKIAWMEFYRDKPEFHVLGDPSFIAKPDKLKVKKLVKEVLDICAGLEPSWLTVPQLPFATDSSRNKINLAMATAAGEWKSKAKINRPLVLPAIFTHQDQSKGKVKWGEKVRQLRRCLDASRAGIVWLVDSSLDDSSGSKTNDRKFTEQLRLFKHLDSVINPKVRRVGGPHWGLNLVGWARGLFSHPAIGLGGGYQYRIPGRPLPPKADVKVALPPLFRRAVAEPELKSWLANAMRSTINSESGLEELRVLIDRWSVYQDPTTKAAKNHAVATYRNWLSQVQVAQPEARAITLYQMLSSAYVFGGNIIATCGDDGLLPKKESPGRHPGEIARQLMLHCLS
jgi:hypothetical protein